MALVEAFKTKPWASRTGVRVSFSRRRGVTITVSKKAFEQLGSPAPGSYCRIFVDVDAMQVRVVIDPLGQFRLSQPNRHPALVRMISAGHDVQLPIPPAEPFEAIWRSVTGQLAIDIVLPRARA